MFKQNPDMKKPSNNLQPVLQAILFFGISIAGLFSSHAQEVKGILLIKSKPSAANTEIWKILEFSIIKERIFPETDFVTGKFAKR